MRKIKEERGIEKGFRKESWLLLATYDKLEKKFEKGKYFSTFATRYGGNGKRRLGCRRGLN